MSDWKQLSYVEFSEMIFEKKTKLSASEYDCMEGKLCREDSVSLAEGIFKI